MDLPISITTVPDGPYDDGAIEEGSYHYKYRGTNPYHPDNVGLREVMKQYKPLIYFFGTVKGMYVPQFPVYIVYDSIPNLSFTIIIEDKLKSITVDQEDPVELYKKHYKTVNTIVRLHQRSFREKVMRAYKSQCSLCRLRHEELLDAAHIIVDKDDWGDPIVQNGLSLCKIHHAAYDKHILGISPDYQVKVREDILEEVDGPMLKFGIQGLNNQQLILPGSRRDWPDQLRLEQRFILF
jgi:putative restriction endonuclease